MNIMPIPGRGVLIFLPGTYTPEPPEPPPAKLGELPLSSDIPGWPAWIDGVHTDGQRYWFEKWGDAGQPGQSGITKPYARYAIQVPSVPRPPAPPPSKPDRDGTTLWIPKDGQEQGSCTFDPIHYD